MAFFTAYIPVGMPQPSRQILSRAAEEFTCIYSRRERGREGEEERER